VIEQLALVLEIVVREQMDWRPSAIDCGELKKLTVPEGAPAVDVTMTVQVMTLPTVAAVEGQVNEDEVEESPVLPVLTVTISLAEQSEAGEEAESVTLYE
jgi:hypothetical protein